jgi:hypothetical protein
MIRWSSSVETNKFENTFRTEWFLLTGGLDTPFAVRFDRLSATASGYSTTGVVKTKPAAETFRGW